jgi:hypothetical protein
MNITRSNLRTAELHFVQEVASVFAPVGMPSSVGRVYGYLLLKQSPISLDQIASDLSLSKGGAWNAARLLERYGHVRRYSEPGGKRAMYAPSENFGSSFLALISLLGTFGNVLHSGASTAATGAASARLAARARFNLLLRQTIETAIIELNASCQSSGSSATGSGLGHKDSTVESIA